MYTVALDLRVVSHDPMMGAAGTLATRMGSSRARASGGIKFRMSGKAGCHVHRAPPGRGICEENLPLSVEVDRPVTPS